MNDKTFSPILEKNNIANTIKNFSIIILIFVLLYEAAIFVKLNPSGESENVL